MNNRLADEVIASKKVAEELKTMNENETRETAHLIKQMAQVLDIFSQPKPFRPREEETKKQLQKLNDILADLKQWEEEIENSTLDAKGKKASFLPSSTWFAWRLILTNVPEICKWAFEKFPDNYILPTKFKNLQNILESHFSQVVYLSSKLSNNQQRALGGQKSNVTAAEYSWNENAISFMRDSYVSPKSNAGKETIEPSSLGPTLKRKERKSVESKEWPIRIPIDQTVRAASDQLSCFRIPNLLQMKSHWIQIPLSEK